MTMEMTDLSALAPLITVIGTAILVVVVDMIRPGDDRLAGGAGVIGLLVALAMVVGIGTGTDAVLGGTYVRDPLTALLDAIFIGVALLTIFVAPAYLRPRGLPLGEYTATLLFAISGAMVIAGAKDLLILFLGLELLVLPGYMLAGYAKRDGYSTEGAIKYFLLGSFSSAIFLFGLAFTWGFTGTTGIAGVAGAVGDLASISPGLAMGLALLTVGVAFKIAAVPFHYWTPDAYQGSPTPVTGYLSVGPKVAAFALILRLFVEALGPLQGDIVNVVIVLSTLTMTLGNLVAITQDNIKRMLAYSSIAHTGYMLVGLAAYGTAPAGSPAAEQGLQGLLFYSVAYAFMNIGAFAVVTALQGRPGVTSQISSFAGLGRRAPLAGALMTLFLLSLTGIPPTAGFLAKALVILAAVQAGGWASVLAVIAVINAAIAAFYYLRVVVYMYMRDAPADAKPLTDSWPMRLGLVVAAVGTLVLGILPGILLPTTEAAAQVLLIVR
jgi:NADH-quinone oxidoreductase subunit N